MEMTGNKGNTKTQGERKVKTFAIVKIQDTLENEKALNWSNAVNDAQRLLVDFKEGRYKYVLVHDGAADSSAHSTTIIVFNVSIADILVICKMYKHDEVEFVDMQDNFYVSFQLWCRNGYWFNKETEKRYEITSNNDKDFYAIVASCFPFADTLINSIDVYEADLKKRSELYDVDWLLCQCLKSYSGRQKYYNRCRLHGNLQKQLEAIRKMKSF